MLYLLFQTIEHLSQENVEEVATVIESPPIETCLDENLDGDYMSDDGETDESGDEFVLDSDEELNSTDLDSGDEDSDNISDENTTTNNFVR